MLLFIQNLSGAYVADSSISTENINITVSLEVLDTGVGLETNPTILYTVSDTSTGIEEPISILIRTVEVSETSVGADSIAISVGTTLTSDNSTSNDTILINCGVNLVDTAQSTDTFSIIVTATVSDTLIGITNLVIENYFALSDISTSIDDANPLFDKVVVDTSNLTIDDVRLIKSNYNYVTLEGNKLNPDTYLELFDFDATMLFDRNNVAGQVSYYTNTPTGGGIAPIVWRTNNYYPMPFEVTGIENRGDGTAPARPQITISNVNQFLLAAVLSLGDLVGMKVTRWRTFYKFTDAGSQPNTLMCYPVDTWIVTKKIAHTKNGIQFEMSSPLDRPGLRLPRQQILRDQGFPGVSRLRVR